MQDFRLHKIWVLGGLPSTFEIIFISRGMVTILKTKESWWNDCLKNVLRLRNNVGRYKKTKGRIMRLLVGYAKNPDFYLRPWSCLFLAFFIWVIIGCFLKSLKVAFSRREVFKFSMKWLPQEFLPPFMNWVKPSFWSLFIITVHIKSLATLLQVWRRVGALAREKERGYLDLKTS